MSDDNQTGRTKYIASCSGGKDSVATLLLARERGEPLDEVVYFELMFDETVSAEYPEHRDFIYGTLKPFVENTLGVPFVILNARRSYEETAVRKRERGDHAGQPKEVDYITGFHHVCIRGAHVGRPQGFLIPGFCKMNRICKAGVSDKYAKSQPRHTVFYVGIAADEPKRLARLDGTTRLSLLAKYGLTEADCFDLCRKHGLLSPAYEIVGGKRLGCWFCPNARDAQWRHMILNHPALFDRLIELEKTPNIVAGRLTRTETPSQLKARLLAHAIGSATSTPSFTAPSMETARRRKPNDRR